MERTLKIKKDELLAKLKQNKEYHVEAFEEASKKWADDMKQASIDIAKTPTDEDALEKLSSVWRAKPKSYEEEYDLAIAQMDMEIRTEIELSIHEFNQLVCDKWSWMAHFTSNVYSASTLALKKKK